MFQSENVFLIRLQRMLNSVEYFPRQFGLDKPRSVNTCGPTPFLDAEFQQKIKFKGKHWEPLAPFSNFLISLTDYNQEIGEGGSLEERSLPGHLTPELAAGGEVHVPQDDPPLRALVLLTSCWELLTNYLL